MRDAGVSEGGNPTIQPEQPRPKADSCIAADSDDDDVGDGDGEMAMVMMMMMGMMVMMMMMVMVAMAKKNMRKRKQDQDRQGFQEQDKNFQLLRANGKDHRTTAASTASKGSNAKRNLSLQAPS